MESLDIAYFLYSWRWLFRILFILTILSGINNAFFSSKWMALTVILLVSGIAYACNYIMAADSMFKQAGSILLKALQKASLIQTASF